MMLATASRLQEGKMWGGGGGGKDFGKKIKRRSKSKKLVISFLKNKNKKETFVFGRMVFEWGRDCVCMS